MGKIWLHGGGAPVVVSWCGGGRHSSGAVRTDVVLWTVLTSNKKLVDIVDNKFQLQSTGLCRLHVGEV